MELLLQRNPEKDKTTIGRLWHDDKLICFTCENGHNEPKIPKETRIPAGRYEIKLRKEGGFHQRYSKWSWHEGMLELQEVPGFKYILIHIGNTNKDTDGCILVGRKEGVIWGKPAVLDSINAYKDVYLYILGFLKKEEVFITIK